MIYAPDRDGLIIFYILIIYGKLKHNILNVNNRDFVNANSRRKNRVYKCNLLIRK